jgi:spermidine synthase
MLLYALTILAGAFLLFQIEPIVAKMILPWFGGSASVWTTCLLFFQMVLLGGYLYAHAMVRYLRPKGQAVLHCALLAASLLTLPAVPGAAWKPAGNENPAFRILGLLAVTIGLPYFLLSATGPLIQAWYARRYEGAAPYRLYALSNAGSMFALLSYPVLTEPAFATRHQAMGWSEAYAAFVALCGIMAFSARTHDGPRAVQVVAEVPAPRIQAQVPGWKPHLWWILLPACASVLLLAITNYLSQDVAAVPFLWILPLSLYLLSFIVCFEKPGWYRRSTFLKLFAIALAGTAYGIEGGEASLSVKAAIPLFSASLLICCIVCHAELVRLKPHPRDLTSFYLMIAVGGALGGVFVGLLAPWLFHGFFELQIGLAATAGVIVLLLRERTAAWALAAMAALGFVVYLGVQIQQSTHGVRVMVRNFYGGLKVSDAGPAPDTIRRFLHGATNHGQQYLDPGRRDWPTTYFDRDSGVGMALQEAANRGPDRVGVIGLGAGTLAAYGRPGDSYRFYEINPLVIQLARSQFTFLQDSKAQLEVVLGDARLSLAGEPSQQFDVLVVDAFSGDSIPVHLLTREAFDLYFRHLKPTGVLAVHVSNHYLDLAPVVHRISQALAKQDAVVQTQPNRTAGIFASTWVLVSGRRAFFEQSPVQRAARPVQDSQRLRIWTDDYSNLFQILK